MRRRPLLLVPLTLALLPALLAAAPPPAASKSIDPALLAGLKARSIGPAAMSGRVADVQAVESNPNVIYVGSAAGGVWKSVNAGLTWDPIFDDQPVASIGAIAIDQGNPDVVWVGTGEANPRNSVSIGNGVYRSLDGGKTWNHLGLEKTEHIYRIVLHPKNPDVAWVSALGQVWGENPERGIFKTTDGGKSWRKVLYVDEKTGGADLLIDPRNPNKLFASMWQYRRWPWISKSGGPGSGLYVTYDGGESWKRYLETDGIPKGELGRIGLALSRSNPDIVYALIEAEKSALVRTTDGGRTWSTMNDDQRTAERPFYYADIRVDPQYPNRVYNLTAALQVSDDSGKTFDRLGRSREIHGDYHALWINPNDAQHLIVGEDGGIAFSRDRGETWQFIFNLPLSQYYHIAVDMDRPYNVYGGLQDNGSWRGPSAVWNDPDIRNQHWDRVGGGDGFDTRPDPQDSMSGYSMSQGGELSRFNLRRREAKTIRVPEPKAGEGRDDGKLNHGKLEKLRWNWNAALAQDPFDPATIYYGSQYVHKSTDRGESWTTISPDLTTDNPEWQKQFESGGITLDVTAAENHTTLVSLAPSAVEKGLLWAGSDDGRLHVTRDGGATWTSVEKNVPGVPANTWIPHITPSRVNAGQAFVVFDNHRRSDFQPYVYRTDDYGKTWKSLATKDLRGWALAVEQDAVNPSLLFLGTEAGLWVSFDAGAKWHPWKHGFPTTPAIDLVIHPRDQDLVVATHGRGIFVLDDITALRTVTPDTLAEPIHLYPSTPAMLYRRQGGGGGGGGRAGSWEFRGENRPFGALLTFSLNAPGLPKPGEKVPSAGGEGKSDKNQVEIRITDPSGRVVRTFKQPGVLGLNRAVWDLGRDPFDATATDARGRRRDGRGSGPILPPGSYGVTVKLGDQEAKGTVQVDLDPALQISAAEWAAWNAMVQRAGALQNAVVAAINRVGEARADVGDVLRKLDARKEATKPAPGAPKEADDADKPLREAAKALQKRLDEVERKLYIPPTVKGIVEDRTAQARIDDAAGAIGSSWGAPNGNFKAYLEVAETATKEALDAVNQLWQGDLAAFRQKVEAAMIGLLATGDPVRIQ